MENRHHPAPHLLIPGKISRIGFWKYLRHPLLEYIGYRTVFKGEIIALIMRVTCLGLKCPLMLIRRMVENDIKNQ